MGNKTAVDKLCELATKARALQARVIKAGGAFHTPLMKPAEEELAKAIDKALPKMKPPRCCIYFNMTGKKVAPGSNPAEFQDLMKKQLKSMIKRIDQDAFKRTENVSV